MKLIALAMAAATAIAQTNPKPEFEVASVKVASGSNGVQGRCHGIDTVYRSTQQQAEAPSPGRCVIANARLSHLIGIAYGISMQNLKTGPDWIQRGDLRFTVEAKAEDPAQVTEQQLLTMLQNLLIDRFQLKFHYETSQTTGFALTIAKGGPRLRKSTSDDTGLTFTGAGGIATGKPVPGQPISMNARKTSIAMLVSLLSGFGGYGPGVDKTGLSGDYDFKLSWDENAGPALPSALQEQLGLRIEAVKVPVSTFVVDSAQKPFPN